ENIIGNNASPLTSSIIFQEKVDLSCLKTLHLLSTYSPQTRIVAENKTGVIETGTPGVSFDLLENPRQRYWVNG
ncbi:MAG: hypothetical protein ACQ9IQ_08570, partial [Nitrospirales bacterium]